MTTVDFQPGELVIIYHSKHIGNNVSSWSINFPKNRNVILYESENLATFIKYIGEETNWYTPHEGKKWSLIMIHEQLRIIESIHLKCL